jgi:hypothetical protein
MTDFDHELPSTAVRYYLDLGKSASAALQEIDSSSRSLATV